MKLAIWEKRILFWHLLLLEANRCGKMVVLHLYLTWSEPVWSANNTSNLLATSQWVYLALVQNYISWNSLLVRAIRSSSWSMRNTVELQQLKFFLLFGRHIMILRLINTKELPFMIKRKISSLLHMIWLKCSWKIHRLSVEKLWDLGNLRKIQHRFLIENPSL